MYAEPVTYRLDELRRHVDAFRKLVSSGWTDKALANYFGSDVHTVKRLKRDINGEYNDRIN